MSGLSPARARPRRVHSRRLLTASGMRVSRRLPAQGHVPTANQRAIISTPVCDPVFCLVFGMDLRLLFGMDLRLHPYSLVAGLLARRTSPNPDFCPLTTGFMHQRRRIHRITSHANVGAVHLTSPMTAMLRRPASSADSPVMRAFAPPGVIRGSTVRAGGERASGRSAV